MSELFQLKKYMFVSHLSGKHAPAKPGLTVRGRTQIHVTWAYPEFPLGRFHRFDLTQNGKVIYSGTDLNFTACRLNENTEYTFTVSFSDLA